MYYVQYINFVLLLSAISTNSVHVFIYTSKYTLSILNWLFIIDSTPRFI